MDEQAKRDRIAFIKQELNRISGGQFEMGGAGALPLDIELEFLESVYAVESSAHTTPGKQLISEGISLPPAEELNDEELPEKLWQVIRGLASKGTYLLHTNHLSDRELYAYLWHDGLNEESWDFSAVPNGAYFIDLVGSGSEEHARLDFRYYADEESRAEWMRDFPDYDMPNREAPPWDRDKDLPKHPLG